MPLRYQHVFAITILVLAGSLTSPPPSIANTAAVPATIRIAGADAGLYGRFAGELAAHLNERFADRYVFESLPTSGSVDNIERLLLDPRVGIALAQEDVAHFYYTGADNDFFTISREDDFRITCLGRLFSEQFYLVVRPGTTRPADLGTVHVGAAKSGTHMTYTTYRRTQRPEWREVVEGNSRDLFAAGEVEGLVLVGATPNIQLMELVEQEVAFDILPVRRTQLSLGLDIYRSTRIPGVLYGLEHDIETISVPAVLLVSRTLPRDVVIAVLEAVRDAEGRAERFPESAAYLDQALVVGEGAPDDVALTAGRIEDLPLPPHPLMVQLTLGRLPMLDFTVAVLVIVALWITWATMRQWNPDFRRRYVRFSATRSHFRDGHFFLATCAWIALSTLGLKYFETAALIMGQQVAGTAFVFMNFFETLGWLMVFIITGFTDSLYPVSGVAKYLPISAKIVGGTFFAYVGVRILTYLIGKFIARRGLMQFRDLSRHVVICNWNARGSRLIEHLRSPDVPDDRRERRIVVVTREEVSDSEREAHDFLVVEMDAWERPGLDQSRAAYADSIIVLAPDHPAGSREADGVAIHTSLAVKNLLCDQKKKTPNQPLPSVVVELNLHDDREYLEELGIDEIVISRDIGMRLVAQTVICPGVTSFFNEILDASPDSNEVYTIDLPPELEGAKADFSHVLEHFRESMATETPVLPIGMKIPARQQLALAQNGEDVRSIVLVNPQHETFTEHGIEQFTGGDQILVLADNPPD